MKCVTDPDGQVPAAIIRQMFELINGSNPLLRLDLSAAECANGIAFQDARTNDIWIGEWVRRIGVAS